MFWLVIVDHRLQPFNVAFLFGTSGPVCPSVAALRVGLLQGWFGWHQGCQHCAVLRAVPIPVLAGRRLQAASSWCHGCGSTGLPCVCFSLFEQVFSSWSAWAILCHPGHAVTHGGEQPLVMPMGNSPGKVQYWRKRPGVVVWCCPFSHGKVPSLSESRPKSLLPHASQLKPMRITRASFPPHHLMPTHSLAMRQATKSQRCFLSHPSCWDAHRTVLVLPATSRTALVISVMRHKAPGVS